MKSLADLLGSFRSEPSRYSKKGSRIKADVFDFLELVRKWPDIIGPRLASHSIPIKNVRKNLTILTRHPALGNQVNFLSREIIKKIEKEFPELRGKIEKLTFLCDPQFFSQREKQTKNIKKKETKHSIPDQTEYHPHSPQVKKWSSEAKKITENFEDEELKSAMEDLYLQVAKNKNF